MSNEGPIDIAQPTERVAKSSAVAEDHGSAIHLGQAVAEGEKSGKKTSGSYARPTEDEATGVPEDN
jgi:hypothetical protein